MNRDRKLTVLETLLEKVRMRGSAPRATPSAATSIAAAPPAADSGSAPTLAGAAAVTQPEVIAEVLARPEQDIAAAHVVQSGPPPREDEFERPRSEPLSEPPSDLEDEGPPSAPRLREGLGMEEEEEDTEQDFQDDEGPIKTPPPESGRQHVASPVPPSESSDELEVDISITVTEAEVAPPPSSPPMESEPPESSRQPLPLPEQTLDLPDGPMPRLAFVSEPEIDLHVRLPVPAPPAAASAPPVSHLSEPPTGKRPIVEPEVRSAPAPSSVPPPVRLMAQPTVAAARSGPPVEVWASIHAPASLRGQVATFVGQNATFTPKSFGELLEASLELGES